MASKVWPSWSFAKTFFIYDHDIVQREEDDPKLAVVFFHPQPPLVSEDMQCLFSGQVMAMVSFLNTLAGCKPRLYRLKRMKIATVHAGRFTMAMASSINTPDEIAIQKIENLYGLFNFFHGSMQRIFKEHGSDHDAFVNHVANIMPSYLSFVHYHDNKVRESFQDIPMVQLPKGSHMVYLKASHLLQWLKRRPKLLGGCILYKHKVLCTQLTPHITRFLLVVKSKQHRLPAITLSLEFEPPVGVKILAAFLTEKEYAMFGKIPPEKLKTVHKSEGASQTCANAKGFDPTAVNYVRGEKKEPNSDRKEQRSSVSDPVPQNIDGEVRPRLQSNLDSSDVHSHDSGQTVDDRNRYGSGDIPSEDDNENIRTEIHLNKPETTFGGNFGENLLNGRLGIGLGENGAIPEDAQGNSCMKNNTRIESERGESDADQERFAKQERVARKLMWREEQEELNPQEDENNPQADENNPQADESRMCNTKVWDLTSDLTSEEVGHIQKESSGYIASLKDTKDLYINEENSCDGRTLSSEARLNGINPSPVSDLSEIKDRLNDEGDSDSRNIKTVPKSQNNQSVLDDSKCKSDIDKRRLSADEGDEEENITMDEECLHEQDRLSNWPPMGQRSISSFSPLSSRRTSMFTEGEKSRSATDDSDNVFDAKVRSTSMISSSKVTEEHTECSEFPEMVNICLYIQVHSEDLVVVFLAEKSLGSDEESVKKIRQTICTQAAELEEELKATENANSKDQSTSPYKYMGYNSFEHSLTSEYRPLYMLTSKTGDVSVSGKKLQVFYLISKLEAQIPSDDVKFFHGARMLHNEFNKDTDLTKVHLGSTSGTVVADQLPGSQEFYFMPSSDTGLSLAKTSPTKGQSKPKVPFGDAWSRR
ncbi:Hermansky-Pudlak syndrome 4 protein [Holothuria leucospilota]|uniref:Hermansky-Pudlak syndrome 4 protein n=1 Tax=Holothuria leucospilota TaxID=206669 RepID=A0A9Q1HB88_HOLLE|nr:Hermansky-Pudlak syndrome 4 protein [Holothuria leucospilota]